MTTASSSEDEGGDVDFDAVAVGAITAAGLRAAPKVRRGVAPKELGLEIELDEDQLYFRTGEALGPRNKRIKQRPPIRAFDTAAPPGVVRLRVEDFSAECVAPQPPVAVTREVRNAPVRPADDKKLKQKEAREMKAERLDKWFGLKKQTLTPEMEKELKAIKLRGNLDPKRFYKGNDSKELPKFFTMATEVGGGMRAAGEKASLDPRPGSGRTFLDDVLRDEKAWEWTGKRHAEVMQRGMASAHSGHGKRDGKGTKRGGAWKKKKRS